jgi:hypothetical protein
MNNKNKTLILDWLSKQVNYKFEHSFKNGWINVGVWDSMLSISLDFRVKEQQELFDLLPVKYKGCLQHGTGILVNEKVLYFNVHDICKVEYPDIVGSKLLTKHKNQGGKGGWTSADDWFYTYLWEINLSDGTTIQYKNQQDYVDLVKGNIIYTKIIDERTLFEFLRNNN